MSAPIEDLLRDARSPLARRRMAAITALIAVPDDPRVDDVLLGALRDRSRGVRWVALGALVNADPDRDIRPIVEALRGDPPESWRPPDASEITRFGIVRLTQANAGTVLGDALTAGGDRQLRHEAAIHLGILRDPRTVPALVAALGDPHVPVRREAARALGGIGQRSAGPGLLAALDDPVPAVRRVARRALLRIRPRLRDVQRFSARTDYGRNQRRRLLRRLVLTTPLAVRRRRTTRRVMRPGRP